MNSKKTMISARDDSIQIQVQICKSRLTKLSRALMKCQNARWNGYDLRSLVR